MRISDWSSDVCSSDLSLDYARERETFGRPLIRNQVIRHKLVDMRTRIDAVKSHLDLLAWQVSNKRTPIAEVRSEEHTTELQSLMRSSYAVSCLKKKKKTKINNNQYSTL